MNTVQKGNKLEDEFYDFLNKQQEDEAFVFDLYPWQLCTILKKEKYFSPDRKGEVEFDIVIELRRNDHSDPHLYVVFECKNHSNSVQERDVRDFSDKVREIFPHASKSVFVFSSRLQSGAENVAKSRKIGLVKFDNSAMDVIAERSVSNQMRSMLAKEQLASSSQKVRALKFSAYYDGEYFGSPGQFLRRIEAGTVESELSPKLESARDTGFMSNSFAKQASIELLSQVQYKGGAVDLEKICRHLNIDVHFTEHEKFDDQGEPVLGVANFDNRSILISAHTNSNRQRFTLAHEIGHFYLRHDLFLLSDEVIGNNLFSYDVDESASDIERLEHQANYFASEILLPSAIFYQKVSELRDVYGITSRGHGYIFVDNQRCNYVPYNHFINELSEYFEVSKQAIEVRLTKENMLNDQRLLF